MRLALGLPGHRGRADVGLRVAGRWQKPGKGWHVMVPKAALSRQMPTFTIILRGGLNAACRRR